jgi:hypothetical protein
MRELQDQRKACSNIECMQEEYCYRGQYRDIRRLSVALQSSRVAGRAGTITGRFNSARIHILTLVSRAADL